MNQEEKRKLDSIWASTCNELQQIISADSVACWFQALKLVSYTDRVLTLRHDQSIHRYWIEENYLPQLTTTASNILGEPITIVFQSDDSVVKVSGGANPVVGTWTDECGGSFDPQLSFQTFVVGMNNRFAASVAKAVAENPSHTYNPLFFYGSAGMGKTHLMHAIGNHIQKNKKHLKVLYVTGKQFTDDYTRTIQRDELDRFRSSYHQAKVVLIDDIEAITSDYRARGEFYHLCDTLSDQQTQIILSSDLPPLRIENCERRLDSCSEFGVIAELHLPEGRTCLAILRNQLNSMPEKFSENVSDEVLNYIVRRIGTNVRCLKDALCQVVATAFLKGEAITVAQAEENLRNFLLKAPPLNVSAHFHANLLTKPSPQFAQLVLKS